MIRVVRFLTRLFAICTLATGMVLLLIRDYSYGSLWYMLIIGGVFVASGLGFCILKLMNPAIPTCYTKYDKMLYRKLPRKVRRRVVECLSVLTDNGWYCSICFYTRDNREYYLDAYGIKTFLKLVDDHIDLF